MNEFQLLVFWGVRMVKRVKLWCWWQIRVKLYGTPVDGSVSP